MHLCNPFIYVKYASIVCMYLCIACMRANHVFARCAGICLMSCDVMSGDVMRCMHVMYVCMYAYVCACDL